MKIIIPYFEQAARAGREAHSVYRGMLMAWQQAYQDSGTNLQPVLLTDQQTPRDIPEWQYEQVAAGEDTPPSESDVLHKVGWLKHQAFDIFGPSLVMDLDAFPQRPLDCLAEVQAPIAMTPDPGVRDQPYPWAEDWPSAARKYNAGVMVLNSSDISVCFREQWRTHETKWLHRITYFDEVIFSALMNDLEGQELSDEMNHHAGYEYPDTQHPCVLHFSGAIRKEALNHYVSQQSGVFARRRRMV